MERENSQKVDFDLHPAPRTFENLFVRICMLFVRICMLSFYVNGELRSGRLFNVNKYAMLAIGENKPNISTEDIAKCIKIYSAKCKRRNFPHDNAVLHVIKQTFQKLEESK